VKAQADAHVSVVPLVRPCVYSRTFATIYQAKERAMALPVLTPEQRQQALAKAAEARKKRAEIKGELKSGKRTLKDVLAHSSEDIVGKMKVSNVLESLPGVGTVRAQKIMEELDISASRRIRGLGAKQREMLLEKFKK
jgi:hypothetical protein